MSQEEQNEKKDLTGSFVASVLLSKEEWDVNKFVKDFTDDWGIELSSCENEEDVLIASIGNKKLVVSFMPIPVPNEEVEENAALNYMWPEAVDVVKGHQAHILIVVLGKDKDLLERGKLFTKAVSSCLKQENALAVYTSTNVFQPEFYIDIASMMKEDEDMLPILNWVWFGIHISDGQTGIYTYGLKTFGKEEIEVYAKADLNDIRDFLLDIVAFVLSDDVTLEDGETIGFTEDQKLSITLSEGIAMEGMTLKIEYPYEENVTSTDA